MLVVVNTLLGRLRNDVYAAQCKVYTQMQCGTAHSFCTNATFTQIHTHTHTHVSVRPICSVCSGIDAKTKNDNGIVCHLRSVVHNKLAHDAWKTI